MSTVDNEHSGRTNEENINKMQNISPDDLEPIYERQH